MVTDIYYDQTVVGHYLCHLHHWSPTQTHVKARQCITLLFIAQCLIQNINSQLNVLALTACNITVTVKLVKATMHFIKQMLHNSNDTLKYVHSSQNILKSIHSALKGSFVELNQEKDLKKCFWIT